MTLNMQASQFQPSITLLNATGDVTITWDEQNKAAILALVQEKMKEGYAFFILTPRKLLPGNKMVKLNKASPKQIKKAVGVVAPDDVVSAILRKQKLDDSKVEALIADGKATLASPAGSDVATLDMGRRARTAEDVVNHQTAAIRRVVGG